jgi:hypothetical protein
VIWWALAASGAAVLASLWAAWATREARAQRERANGYAREIDRRGHIITRMEEINRETNKRKDQMASGSDAERFDASVDIVSDIAKNPRDPDKS